MIGYYVHHQGWGHLHRAQALATALDEPVAGLSSLPRPEGWAGDWVQLDRDDRDPVPRDVTAGGQLHWVPRSDPGLRARTAAVSRWIDRAEPRLVVVDVSVEVAVQVRLHGVPVVTVVLPGVRTDPAHLLGFRVSDGLVATWPAEAGGLLPGLPEDVLDRVTCIGAVSRFAPALRPPRRTGQPRVALLQGRGGGLLTERSGDRLRALAPEWHWTGVGGPFGWVEDPSGVLQDADVVVTHAGQGSVADVASLGRPAVVVPADRPFDEQAATAHALSDDRWPALVLDTFPTSGWADVLDRAARLDGTRWRTWCDGQAGARFAAVVTEVATGLRTGTAGPTPPPSATGLRSA